MCHSDPGAGSIIPVLQSHSQLPLAEFPLLECDGLLGRQADGRGYLILLDPAACPVQAVIEPLAFSPPRL